MKAGFACVLVCMAALTVSASSGASEDVGPRAKSAKKIVVATVRHVESRFDSNEWGDQLIVSDAELDVEETLKGSAAGTVTVTVEGGTVGDLTLDVSDMPSMKKGDRAVLFLGEESNGKHKPNGRGAGVMKLNSSNRTEEGGLNLDDLKQMIKDAR